MRKFSFLFFLFFFSLALGMADPLPSDLDLLLKKIEEGNVLFQNYQQSLKIKKSSSASNQLPALLQSRQEAIGLAMKTYGISPFDQPGWSVEASQFRSANWFVGPWGRGILGNQAFQSPAWLGASLTALRFQFDHLNQWPYLLEDQHLALALTYRFVLSKADDLKLSTEERAQFEELSKRHADLLSPTRLANLQTQQWPRVTPLPSEPAKTGALFYTPPALHAEDRFLRVSLMADSGPVSKVPILLATPKEAGYSLRDSVTTNEKGEGVFDLDGSANSILLVPCIKDGPFPHRLTVLPSENSVPSGGPPNFSNLPTALEPKTEQVWSGNNLLDREGKTVLTLGNEERPILAGSSTYLVTRIPSRLPGSREIRLATPNGTLAFSISLVVVRGELKEKTLHRGDHTDLIIQEYGIPRADAWIALDGSHLTFDDGSSRKTMELEEKKPAAVPVHADVPGHFKIGFGILHPLREKAIAKLLELRATLEKAETKALLDQAVWAIEQGEVARAESFLEELRYQILLREGKVLPFNEFFGSSGLDIP